MTSLAQCLADMGKTLTGSDVEEDFVTKEVLATIEAEILPFSEIENLHSTTYHLQLLIYTSAHGGPQNPEVLWAKQNGIPTLSQAEALAQLFNAKNGIAVCGVGGKSTTSAMITWILETLKFKPSFSVGVGKVVGMDRTGRWNEESEYFVAEADEYVIDPKAEIPTPRFSFLKPQIIVCTNLKFDHPDVYKTFGDTKEAYLQFFNNLKQTGKLIINGDDNELLQLAKAFLQSRSDAQLITYGANPSNDYILSGYIIENGQSKSLLTSNNLPPTNITLQIPGLFNHFNATAAVIASSFITTSVNESAQALNDFKSTQRRFEFIGEKSGIKYYDDYAHHPNEISSAIQALSDFFPTQRKVIAFQPHTFSRTKQLFDDFVDSFAQAEEVLLLDIFASARESFDSSITSENLVRAIREKYPKIHIQNISSVEKLAEYCQRELKAGDVMITLGAGDIYQVHDQIVE